MAVNSYMGMADMTFEEAMSFLQKSANVNGTLPIDFYKEVLKKGIIKSSDVVKAMEENSLDMAIEDDKLFEQLLNAEDTETETKPQTFADIASLYSEKKWNRFMVDRISFWAAAYFDELQAMWQTSARDNSIFTAWKQEAEIDLSPEATGLKGFRKYIASLPDHYLDAVALALDELEVPGEMMDFYLNGLLMKMNGWAGFAARLDWEAGLNNTESHALQEFLAIMIVWDAAIKKLLNEAELDQHWDRHKNDTLELLDINKADDSLVNRLVLQKAYDLAHQRSIIRQINKQESKPGPEKAKPKVQAAFCIDVRSEVFRRNFEAVDSEIETIGFAGFFGFPINYMPLAKESGRNQCPVLINSSHTVREKIEDAAAHEKAVNGRLRKNQFSKAMKAFKKGAISCFGFVSPLGIYFLPKLLTDSFGLTRPVDHPDNFGLTKSQVKQKGVELTHNSETINSGIALKDRVKMGYSALKGMSLTEDFASIVLIAGHGSTTTNNPHATGLDCGACGGNSGEANARVAAAILNNPAVRAGIKDLGIEIPESTLFVAGLHDTTTDILSLFETDSFFKKPSHQKELEDLKYSLSLAGEKTRMERSRRMNMKSADVNSEIINRSKDWSQVRPEWGLAGCSSFIVAPRERTSNLNLGGKSFLHNYSWQKDKDFIVLELIMTAPMVVTSWINLQYYASTVDNKTFGSGNKTLHNVVGGVGVLEGFAGDLRTGLPMQSVNDGMKFQHNPLRLKVFIEAPVDQMSKILERNEGIRNLCDNQWIFLYAINDEGKVAYRYVGDLQWEMI